MKIINKVNYLFIIAAIIFLGCNSYDIESKDENIKSKKTNTEIAKESIELINVRVIPEILGNTFELRLVLSNNSEREFYFINNLLVFEHTDNGTTMADVTGDLRFNSICFYEKNEPKAYVGDVVESKMSMYSEKDIFIINAKKERVIRVSWLIDDVTKDVIRKKELKYFIRLVLTDHSFDTYEDEDILVKFEAELRNGVLAPNGFSNSLRVDKNYLGDWKFYFKKIEGSLEL